ncbi:MAG: hypothetical protein DRP35_07015 [Candidatus Zixiibacteriota bacterium]|nr:MAG: hypothetical protein DRP35_07015 [candidate division Zixibacteria bacterium]
MAELYLVEFKGSRKEYFYNTFYHKLCEEDYVVTQTDRGEDLGVILKKIDIEIEFVDDDKPQSILRKAGKDDLQRYEELQENDHKCKREIKDLIRKHGLVMKVVDIETQLDGNKMTIFFTADQRVDFRGLVKDLAFCYKTRIELRQIGVRDEARRVGGYGICGQMQCCNSFIKSFNPISTQQAREQDLPMNPAKISGNCGRLLCCLRFEVEQYRTCKKKFPNPGTKVNTKEGNGVISRIDIFNEEAVIVDEEHVQFRAKAGDILEVSKDRAEKSKVTSSSGKEFLEEEPDVEDVSKLDENDN